MRARPRRTFYTLVQKLFKAVHNIRRNARTSDSFVWLKQFPMQTNFCEMAVASLFKSSVAAAGCPSCFFAATDALGQVSLTYPARRRQTEADGFWTQICPLFLYRRRKNMALWLVWTFFSRQSCSLKSKMCRPTGWQVWKVLINWTV